MMRKYEYGRIAVLEVNLNDAGLAPEIVAEILQGGEAIGRSTTPAKKADWMCGAMRAMDRLVDTRTRRSVREACACCLGGKRAQLAKAIAKRGGTLEERIAAANEAKLLFGNSVRLQDDGRIAVGFFADGAASYRCVCLPGAKEPLPVTYCYCCGGHVKHHLQTVLGRKLRVLVRSSALASGGKKPCSFVFTLLPDRK